MNYWIGVVSRQHVLRGVELGIAQIQHGKKLGLARMQSGDGFIYYSPKDTLRGTTPLQRFTAIGNIADDELWQVSDGDFKPWRRKVSYYPATEAPIRPLLDMLSFSSGNPRWGYFFRYGLVPITAQDFRLIAEVMGVADIVGPHPSPE